MKEKDEKGGCSLKIGLSFEAFFHQCRRLIQMEDHKGVKCSQVLIDRFSF